jgi:hypothetical protein
MYTSVKETDMSTPYKRKQIVVDNFDMFGDRHTYVNTFMSES